MQVLVAGATGFIGTRLVRALAARDTAVRCLTRDAAPAERLEAIGCEVVRADVTEPQTLAGVGKGIDVAYYLVHLMRGGATELAERERGAASAFARMAGDAGVGRIIYLGGLGEDPGSEHLQSRHLTAQTLAAEGPPLTYFRAGIVLGAKSASFRILREIVERVPIVLAPDWLELRTQPIGVEDMIDYLLQAPELVASTGREVQVGGPDVLSYAELLDEMARALGKDPRPKLRAKVSPDSAGSAAAAVTSSEDDDLVAALVESLATETIVTDPSGAALFDIEPEPLGLALSRALDEADHVVESSS